MTAEVSMEVTLRQGEDRVEIAPTYQLEGEPGALILLERPRRHWQLTPPTLYSTTPI